MFKIEQLKRDRLWTDEKVNSVLNHRRRNMKECATVPLTYASISTDVEERRKNCDALLISHQKLNALPLQYEACMACLGN